MVQTVPHGVLNNQLDISHIGAILLSVVRMVVYKRKTFRIVTQPVEACKNMWQTRWEAVRKMWVRLQAGNVSRHVGEGTSVGVCSGAPADCAHWCWCTHPCTLVHQLIVHRCTHLCTLAVHHLIVHHHWSTHLTTTLSTTPAFKGLAPSVPFMIRPIFLESPNDSLKGCPATHPRKAV